MTHTPNEAATNEDFEFRALAEARNYRAALLGEFGPHLRGEVVEVGAGIGQLTGGLAALDGVDRLTAVEPDPRFARDFRNAHPTVDLFPGTAADLPAESAWDGLVSVNVLEHIEDDLGELAAWRRLLAPREGTLCLFVPARPEIYAPLDKDFGHFRRYTRPDLTAKLTNSGFRIEHLCYFNFIGYFAWWFSFRLLGQRGFNPASVRLFDRAIFPWAHALERRFLRPPIGQSLLAVARAT